MDKPLTSASDHTQRTRKKRATSIQVSKIILNHRASSFRCVMAIWRPSEKRTKCVAAPIAALRTFLPPGWGCPAGSASEGSAAPSHAATSTAPCTNTHTQHPWSIFDHHAREWVDSSRIHLSHTFLVWVESSPQKGILSLSDWCIGTDSNQRRV